MSGGRDAVWKAGFSKMPPPPPRRPAPQDPEPEGADGAAPGTRPLTVVPAAHDETLDAAPHAAGAEAPAPVREGATVGPAAPPTVARGAGSNPSQVAPGPAAAELSGSAPAPTAAPVPAPPEPSPVTAPTAPAAAPLPRPSSSAASLTGRRVTATEVRSARTAARHAAAVVQGLAGGGVPVQALEAELAADRLHLVLDADGDPEDVLNNADLIADALTVDDVECSTDGHRVHVWAVVGTASGPRQVAAWVPVGVRDAVRAKRDETGETVTAVVLSAFNRQAGPDGVGLARLFPDAAAAAPGPMTIAARKLRPGGHTSVQLWLYLHPSQEATLDHAVTRTGAGSRSALITRILEEDLGLEPTGR